jgi:predicted ATP-binding protein involved in virulence
MAMKLVRFTGSGIHGYLRITIKFNKSLTFITGINGSGKTSALNAIVALITPDLRILAGLQFSELSLELENNGEKITVSAAADAGRNILILSSMSKDKFSFKKYTTDSDLPPSRQLEAEAEHYREVLSNNLLNPVLRSIGALPTPMFLGLDRRARYEDEVIKRSRLQSPWRLSRSTHSVFSTSLARSLVDAEDLAVTKYRDALIESGGIAEALQRELLLNLLTVDTGDQGTFGSLSVPSANDLKEIAAVKRDLEALPQILRLPRQEVLERVAPFLNALQAVAAKIPKNADIDELMRPDSRHSPIWESIFNWSTNQVHLKRIKVISSIVEKYNMRRSETFAPTIKYIDLINRFVKDSGKRIQFNEKGYISVKMDGVADEAQVSSLSSGEAQIFVILTHLAFSPYAQNNVFIIDEPELSLHVQWQELFVSSVLEANPNIQYVLATHSPSIILDRVKDCIDISRKFKPTAGVTSQ